MLSLGVLGKFAELYAKTSGNGGVSFAGVNTGSGKGGVSCKINTTFTHNILFVIAQ